MDSAARAARWPKSQDFFNRKGLVSVRGEIRRAFYVMQQFYQGKRKEYE